MMGIPSIDNIPNENISVRGLENIEIPFVGAASAAKQKDIAAEVSAVT